MIDQGLLLLDLHLNHICLNIGPQNVFIIQITEI